MIDFRTTEVQVISNLRKANIKIKMEYILDNKKYNDEGAIFYIISEDDKIIEKTTNHLGEIEMLLPLGKYTIMQKYSQMNFEMQTAEIEITNYEEQTVTFLNYLEENKNNEIENSVETIKKEENKLLISEEQSDTDLNVSDSKKETVLINVPNTFKSASITFWLIISLFLTLGIYLYAKD